MIMVKMEDTTATSNSLQRCVCRADRSPAVQRHAESGGCMGAVCGSISQTGGMEAAVATVRGFRGSVNNL